MKIWNATTNYGLNGFHLSFERKYDRSGEFSFWISTFTVFIADFSSQAILSAMEFSIKFHSFLILFVLLCSIASGEANRFEYTNASCISHDKKIIDISFCEVSGTSIAVKGTIIRSLNKPFYVSRKITSKRINNTKLCLQLRLLVRRRANKSENFRDIINIPRFEWCDIMDSANVNSFQKLWLGICKEAFPHLFHACPYSVSINVSIMASTYFVASKTRLKGIIEGNASFRADQFPMFPAGSYISTYILSSSRKLYATAHFETVFFDWRSKGWFKIFKMEQNYPAAWIKCIRVDKSVIF